MGKKHVAVSLRKPPSPEKADAFVTGAVADTAAPPSEIRETTQAQQAQESPPPKAEEAVIAASAPIEALSVSVSPEPPPVSAVLVGNDGRTRRAVTIYLPDVLADRLVLHCIEQDRDVSNFIGEAVRDHLEMRLGPAPVASAPDAATGDARDAAPAGKTPFRGANPFRAGDHDSAQTRVDRFIQVSRVLVTLWRQRPWAA